MPMRGWSRLRFRVPTSVPRFPAVYVVYGLQSVVYVGQTNNLQRRFRWYGTKWNAARTVKYCIVLGDDERLALERRLIERLRPSMNVQHTGRYRSQRSRWIA